MSVTIFPGEKPHNSTFYNAVFLFILSNCVFYHFHFSGNLSPVILRSSAITIDELTLFWTTVKSVIIHHSWYYYLHLTREEMGKVSVMRRNKTTCLSMLNLFCLLSFQNNIISSLSPWLSLHLLIFCTKSQTIPQSPHLPSVPVIHFRLSEFVFTPTLTSNFCFQPLLCVLACSAF